MSKPSRHSALFSLDDALFGSKPRKIIPHEFVLDALAPLAPITRPMFGCLAIYVADKIVLALRDKSAYPADNGVWLATSEEHHESLRREFPNLRSIQVFGKSVTAWQVLPADAPDFEEASLRVCELIAARDPRIGKVPKRRTSGSQKTKGPKRGRDDSSTAKIVPGRPYHGSNRARKSGGTIGQTSSRRPKIR
ncbi:MAG: hypothetical protein JO185_00785 [Acidobacteriaceae bacterium]|nr:hypothetical protein [Acidobacteriaceae bacterium]